MEQQLSLPGLRTMMDQAREATHGALFLQQLVNRKTSDENDKCLEEEPTPMAKVFCVDRSTLDADVCSEFIG